MNEVGATIGNVEYTLVCIGATNLVGATLHLRVIVDDGAVAYLNDHELYRLHMPDGAVDYSTLARDHEATLEGPFELASTFLHPGDNLLAVEVHQVNSGSSDVVFGLSLTAVLTITNTPPDSGTGTTILNEILARNVSLTNAVGAVTDWVELRNPLTATANLSDWSLSDEPDVPRKWVFPPNTHVPAGGFLVVTCDPDSPPSTANTGFGLNAQGGTICLFGPRSRGTPLADSLAYGLQVPDLTLGRSADEGPWELCTPSPGWPNRPVALGDPGFLRVNEWMASPYSGDDWFEVFNADPQPVELSGLTLSDDPYQPDQSVIPPLSFIGTGLGAYTVFRADGAPNKGPDHVAFKLSAGGEFIGLFDRDGLPIDAVSFGPQQAGVSQGRLPDGSALIATFTTVPTPGSPNVVDPAQDSDRDGLPDLWELAHLLNRFDPRDAAVDSDRDGLTNLQEYWAGTDPWNSSDRLQVRVQSRADGFLALEFATVPGRQYRLEQCADVAHPIWVPVGDNVSGTGGWVLVLDPAPDLAAQRFYRAAVVP